MSQTPTKEQGFELMALLPTDTPCYMAEAWLSAMHCTIGHVEMMADFRLTITVLR